MLVIFVNVTLISSYHLYLTAILSIVIVKWRLLLTIRPSIVSVRSFNILCAEGLQPLQIHTRMQAVYALLLLPKTGLQQSLCAMGSSPFVRGPKKLANGLIGSNCTSA